MELKLEKGNGTLELEIKKKKLPLKSFSGIIYDTPKKFLIF
jgi:hypothetical protein